jgi:hypothetical protein
VSIAKNILYTTYYVHDLEPRYCVRYSCYATNWMVYGLNPGRVKRFSHLQTSRPALVSIQVPIQQVTELFPVVKRPEREVNHIVQSLRIKHTFTRRIRV